jgi:fatty acid desaturase
MFLNNNLHMLHHAEPGLAWYRLPARYRAERARLLAANGGYLMRGYAEVFARYLLWPKERPVHPFADRAAVPVTGPLAAAVAATAQTAAPLNTEAAV